MTIAAGFLYDNGLLLCADTQYTGQLKMHASKLLRKTYRDGSKSVFATVGHGRYARMGVQLIQDSISDLPAAERTLSKMHLVLAAGVKMLHQEHIFKHPDRDSISVQYLVGLWSAMDTRLAFFVTDDTAVVRTYGYEVIGSGEVIAQYLTRPKYRRVDSIDTKPRHTESEVRRMAVVALKEAKKVDPFCGGDSEYVTLTNSGRMSPVQKLTKGSRRQSAAHRRIRKRGRVRNRPRARGR